MVDAAPASLAATKKDPTIAERAYAAIGSIVDGLSGVFTRKADPALAAVITDPNSKAILESPGTSLVTGGTSMISQTLTAVGGRNKALQEAEDAALGNSTPSTTPPPMKP